MQRLIACLITVMSVLLLVNSGGCKKESSSSTTAPAGSAGGGTGGAEALRLMLDWHPEPEFGGFYAAQIDSSFKMHGLNVVIKSAGEGAAMWQLVAEGKADFGTTAADQVLVARAQGADVVALFSVYQTCPQGVMVHKARKFTGLGDVFTNPGTLEAEDNAWLHYCRKKYGAKDLKIISYSGGIGNFMAKADDSQQCFVTSEPIQAKKQGGDPQTFLIAESGFNPYTTVVICRGDMVRKYPAVVKAMVASCRAGWRAYLTDPAPANQLMGTLNHDMDAETFAAAAEAQKRLIQLDDTSAAPVGLMTTARWDQLSKQLVELDVLKAPVAGSDCFVDVDKLP